MFLSLRQSYIETIENDKRELRRNIGLAEINEQVRQLNYEFMTTNDDATVIHLCERVALEAALLRHYRMKGE